MGGKTNRISFIRGSRNGHNNRELKTGRHVIWTRTTRIPLRQLKTRTNTGAPEE